MSNYLTEREEKIIFWSGIVAALVSFLTACYSISINKIDFELSFNLLVAFIGALPLGVMIVAFLEKTLKIDSFVGRFAAYVTMALLLTLLVMTIAILIL